MSAAAAAASGAKRKRPSFPISPSDSPAKRRSQSRGATADPPTLVTVPPPHGSQWCVSLHAAREDDKFIDIKLLVGGRKIPAHKAVLVSFSPYLDGLLTCGLAESTQTGHEMAVGDESTNGRAVEAIVDLMYTGKLSLSASTVGSVIRTANLLQVGAAEKAACDFFVESLEPSTASDALSFAASFAECGAHARELQERCMGYAVDHFAECSAEVSFMELPCEAVAELIASEDLSCDEAVVVDAVRAWSERDVAGRAGALKSLVPLIRWPLLPVVARLSLWAEPVLQRMMTQDAGGCALGARLMLECSAEFAKSDAAAACPRLKRRKGSAVPVPPLAFTAMSHRHYVAREDGALLTSKSMAGYRAALCGDVVMSSGQSCAEITVVQMDTMMIGAARPTVDVETPGAYRSGDFWGVENQQGRIVRNSSVPLGSWLGMEGFSTGDVLRLLLDSDAGTLTVKKNGTLLGVAVTEGLTGDLCWAVSCANKANDSVRIKAVDPAEF